DLGFDIVGGWRGLRGFPVDLKPPIVTGLNTVVDRRCDALAGRSAMTSITPDHLARGAFIYVRQSTSDQLLHNHESRRRQYGLVDRARALGWTAVEVIDDDLGRSGSGISRPGFEKLLAAICEGRVGAVVLSLK